MFSGLWHQRHIATDQSDDQFAATDCGLNDHVVACDPSNRCSIHGSVLQRENIQISGSISAELVAGSVDLMELDLSNTRFNSS